MILLALAIALLVYHMIHSALHRARANDLRIYKASAARLTDSKQWESTMY